ncbi:MAG TPA: CpsD/CapB family tyrosine-protein kinase [Pyrinomonadaceae bacterium]|nr:CpsD/CapB family tyrosine-protein kinase [Pyrinomonadaceae bacterium]
MGRVFDAIRRSSTTENSGVQNPRPSQSSQSSEQRNGGDNQIPTARQIEEELFRGSSIMSQNNALHSSASTAHTADAPGGSALPGGMTSRAVGATLGAAGATRAAGFVSYDISAARVEPHLVAVSQPRSGYCEQFRSLRTRLLQAGERRQMRTFVITSVGIGEGKTLTALNLAWLLAQTDGVRALVIDSDLRQPCATDYLGIDAPIGLSEVLGGELGLEEAIVRLDPAGLFLLPGGRARDDVAELLSGPTFARLIADCRRMFDYIIIDAPPMGIFSDASVLISRADAALLVVRAGKTRYAQLDKLIEQLPKERLLGVVLNRADEKTDSSAYYYQQRYSHRDRALPAEASLTLPNETSNEEVGIVN